MTLKVLILKKIVNLLKWPWPETVQTTFFLKTKNTQNTLTTIYSKQIFPTLTQHFIGYPENR